MFFLPDLMWQLVSKQSIFVNLLIKGLKSDLCDMYGRSSKGLISLIMMRLGDDSARCLHTSLKMTSHSLIKSTFSLWKGHPRVAKSKVLVFLWSRALTNSIRTGVLRGMVFPCFEKIRMYARKSSFTLGAEIYINFVNISLVKRAKRIIPTNPDISGHLHWNGWDCFPLTDSKLLLACLDAVGIGRFFLTWCSQRTPAVSCLLHPFCITHKR